MTDHFRDHPSGPPVDLLELSETAQDLLVARATEGLSEPETQELSRLLTAEGAGDLDGFDDLELAAAAIELGELSALSSVGSETDRPSVPGGMSSDLTDRILSATAGLSVPVSRTPAAEQKAWEPRLSGDSARTSDTGPSVMQFPVSAAVGWGLAAVMAMVAAVGWLRPGSSSGTSDAIPQATALSAAEQYRDLAASASVVQAGWSVLEAENHPEFAEVSGDIVFLPSEQAGVMRFVGLPVNDPGEYQYQLWIADPSRDTEPVDGGVFDVTAEGEVFVPVDAKLMAMSPAAFVITVEKPGGVVESEPANYRLLAAVEAG